MAKARSRLSLSVVLRVAITGIRRGVARRSRGSARYSAHARIRSALRFSTRGLGRLGRFRKHDIAVACRARRQSSPTDQPGTSEALVCSCPRACMPQRHRALKLLNRQRRRGWNRSPRRTHHSTPKWLDTRRCSATECIEVATDPGSQTAARNTDPRRTYGPRVQLFVVARSSPLHSQLGGAVAARKRP